MVGGFVHVKVQILANKVAVVQDQVCGDWSQPHCFISINFLYSVKVLVFSSGKNVNAKNDWSRINAFKV